MLAWTLCKLNKLNLNFVRQVKCLNSVNSLFSLRRNQASSHDSVVEHVFGHPMNATTWQAMQAHGKRLLPAVVSCVCALAEPFYERFVNGLACVDLVM